MDLYPEKNMAIVKFLLPEDAAKYFNSVYNGETSRGIPWPGQPERLIGLGRSRKDERPNEMQRAMADSMVSRCVRINNLTDSHTERFLRRTCLQDGRILENLIIGKDGSTMVSIAWRH